MNRDEIVLAAMAAAGDNATFTPVQVQKLFFLVDREAAEAVGGPHFDFIAYDYGPFDRAVYDQLDELADQGLVKIDVTKSYREYSLTQVGSQEGVDILERLPEASRRFLSSASKWVRSLSFQQLVAAIYKRYPDMKSNSIFQQ